MICLRFMVLYATVSYSRSVLPKRAMVRSLTLSRDVYCGIG